MNLPKLLITAFLAATCIAFSSIAASAQSDDKTLLGPSFQIALHLVVGGGDGAVKGELPANLSAVTRQLRSAVPYTNYRLASTYIGRVGNAGTFEYKSVAGLLGRSEGDPATFLEWSVRDIRLIGNEYRADSVRFGARVPVKTLLPSGDGGKLNQMVNYEPIGLTFQRLGVPENVPTLLGTLTLPQAGETLFLIMTVSRTDR